MKLVNIQGRVPEDHFKKVRAMMDEKGLTWNDVMTLCLIAILDGDVEI